MSGPPNLPTKKKGKKFIKAWKTEKDNLKERFSWVLSSHQLWVLQWSQYNITLKVRRASIIRSMHHEHMNNVSYWVVLVIWYTLWKFTQTIGSHSLDYCCGCDRLILKTRANICKRHNICNTPYMNVVLKHSPGKALMSMTACWPVWLLMITSMPKSDTLKACRKDLDSSLMTSSLGGWDTPSTLSRYKDGNRKRKHFKYAETLL